MKRNQKTLDLMLQAERRDITWPDVIAANKHMPEGCKTDPFDHTDTVVAGVKLSIEFDEKIRGEIDAVDQTHYLMGRNYDPMMDPDFWEENDPGSSVHNETCHEYWDRGLNCTHIPEQERNAIVNGEVDPGWGQFD